MDLTFPFLDDLALGVARNRVSAESYLARAEIGRLGPFIELAMLDRAGALPLNAMPLCKMRRALTRALEPTQRGRGVCFTDANSKVGFIVTSRDPEADDQADWISFGLKAQEAAEFSALSKPAARALIGALREIETNLHEHSGRPEDGIVAFRGTSYDFEFVVGDSGIGILAGFQQSPDYSDLTDAGTAIRLALTNGHSRLRYANPDRGFGFRSLFLGLANLNGELRFRSDDHAVTIDGASPSLMSAQLSQRIPLQGFVASIVCHLRPNSTRQ